MIILLDISWFLNLYKYNKDTKMKCNTKEAFKLFVKDMKFIKYSLRAIALAGIFWFFYILPIIIEFFKHLTLGKYVWYFIFIVEGVFVLVGSGMLCMALFILLKTLYFELKYYINDLCKRSLLVSK